MHLFHLSFSLPPLGGSSRSSSGSPPGAGPVSFTRSHPVTETLMCVCVFTSPITLYQAVDRSCNRMSAFLDSTALFSVPTRQIAKKVTLTVTTDQPAILHHKHIPEFLDYSSPVCLINPHVHLHVRPTIDEKTLRHNVGKTLLGLCWTILFQLH